MKSGKLGMVHALEFECQAPLKFYEHCASCARFGNECPDLALGLEILRGKKTVDYTGKEPASDKVDAKRFNCLAPLHYFEKSRKKCSHKGRCREEGLLLALLTNRKELVYSQKAVVEFPRLKHHHVPAELEKDKSPKIYTC